MNDDVPMGDRCGGDDNLPVQVKDVEDCFKLSVEDQLRYHPPDEERKLKHEEVNQAAIDLALALEKSSLALEKFMRVSGETLSSNCYTTSRVEYQVHNALRPLRDVLYDESYIFLVQQARMFINQGLTMNALCSRQCKGHCSNRAQEQIEYSW